MEEKFIQMTKHETNELSFVTNSKITKNEFKRAWELLGERAFEYAELVGGGDGWTMDCIVRIQRRKTEAETVLPDSAG